VVVVVQVAVVARVVVKDVKLGPGVQVQVLVVLVLVLVVVK